VADQDQRRGGEAKKIEIVLSDSFAMQIESPDTFVPPTGASHTGS
jgi:hypothetical protein